MKIAVVGATGMVGQVMLKVLQERNFPLTELIPVASEKSLGKKVTFKNKEIDIVDINTAIQKKPDIALFSAGGETSLTYAPKFAEVGTTVIDNSSAWRMKEGYPLVVPEINAGILTKEHKIIANPNCSTIQLVMALYPLHKKYNIERIVVSTYQSITGTGKKAVDQLENERAGITGEQAYPYPIDKNCIPHCDVFLESGYTKEEIKLMTEPNKIMQTNIKITATAVRVPVVGGHSESVNISFSNDFNLSDIRKILSDTPGVVLQDNPDTLTYPMPKYAEGKNDVFVGRIRKDESIKNGLNLWIVADNLRKGAATNAIQIAEYLINNKLV
jgi:aspartate-semialdehyde dehydrogenase